MIMFFPAYGQIINDHGKGNHLCILNADVNRICTKSVISFSPIYLYRKLIKP